MKAQQMNVFHRIGAAAVFGVAFGAFGLAAAQAQTPNVSVTDAWVRGTVPQQQGSGAFMRLTAAQATRLVGVSTPVAAMAEVHEMKTGADGVMQMKALAALDLPAGKPVELKPGSYHVMLMGLKQQLKAGDLVPLTLSFDNGNGKKETQELKLPVKALGQ